MIIPKNIITPRHNQIPPIDPMPCAFHSISSREQ